MGLLQAARTTDQMISKEETDELVKLYFSRIHTVFPIL